MHVFVTGASGFIGSWLVDALLQDGHSVVALARTPKKIASLAGREHLRIVEGTLAQGQLIAKELADCDACVHVALGWGDTAPEMLARDTTWSVALADIAARAGVERFVYTSSVAAIGPFSAGMDETTPLRPGDFYGATKAATEAYLFALSAQTKMAINVVRPGYTFGNPVASGCPTQPDDRFRRIGRLARKGDPIAVQPGDGTQFISAAQLAGIFVAVLESPLDREVFHGLGRPFVTWESIARRAVELSGGRSRVDLTGEPSEPAHFHLGKVESHFELDLDASEALDEHIRWCLSHG